LDEDSKEEHDSDIDFGGDSSDDALVASKGLGLLDFFYPLRIGIISILSPALGLAFVAHRSDLQVFLYLKLWPILFLWTVRFNRGTSYDTFCFYFLFPAEAFFAFFACIRP
jgi:hypothetical protein